jgi:hypothetical protein
MVRHGGAVVRGISLLFCVSLSGCWLSTGEISDVIGGDADTDVDADSDTDADTDADSDADVDIDFTISPEQGAVGQQVTLTGGPFGDDVTVRFDGDAADVLSTASDSVVVEVPNGAEGYVDVEVDSSEGSSSHGQPYFRWQNGAGKTGAVGEVIWYDYVGTYWDDPTDSGEAHLGFVHPGTFAASDLYGPSGISGDCEYDWSPPSGLSGYPAFGNSLSLQTLTGRTLDFSFSNSEWVVPDFDASKWANGQDWKLRAGGTPDEWPPLVVDDFVHTPDPISVTYPAINGSSAPDVFPGFDIDWSTTGAGDFVVIYLDRYAGGSDPVESLTCVVPDDGSFTTPWDGWSDWNSGEQITILVGRVTVSDVLLPSGATAEVAGVRYSVGAAFQF